MLTKNYTVSIPYKGNDNYLFVREIINPAEPAGGQDVRASPAAHSAVLPKQQRVACEKPVWTL